MTTYDYELADYGPDRVVVIQWAQCGSITFVRELGAKATIEQ